MVQLFVSKILMILGLSDLPPILLILLAIESYLLSLLFFFLMVYRYRKQPATGTTQLLWPAIAVHRRLRHVPV